MLYDTLNLISDVLIFAGLAGGLVFASSYAMFFRWRKTAAGRALMYFVIAIISLFVLNALGVWTDNDYPLREYIRFGTYTALVWTIWHLVGVLWRGWRDGDVKPLDIQSRKRNEGETHE